MDVVWQRQLRAASADAHPDISRAISHASAQMSRAETAGAGAEGSETEEGAHGAAADVVIAGAVPTLCVKDVDALCATLCACEVVSTLVLSSCGLTAACTAPIVDAVRVSTCLHTLGLSDNRLGDTGSRLIADALAVNFSVTVLDVSGNGIGAAGADALAVALQLNETLERVNMARNEAGRGAGAFADALRVNTTLVALDLSSNAIPDATVAVVTDALADNTALQTLYIGGNGDALANTSAVADAPALAPVSLPSAPAPLAVAVPTSTHEAHASVLSAGDASLVGHHGAAYAAYVGQWDASMLVGAVLLDRVILQGLVSQEGPEAVFTGLDTQSGQRTCVWVSAGSRITLLCKMSAYLVAAAHEGGPHVAATVVSGYDATHDHHCIALQRPFFTLDDWLEGRADPAAVQGETRAGVAAEIIQAALFLTQRQVVHATLDATRWGRFSRGWRFTDVSGILFEGTLAPAQPLSFFTAPEHARLYAALEGDDVCAVPASRPAFLWRLGMLLLQVFVPGVLDAFRGSARAFFRGLADDPEVCLRVGEVPGEWGVCVAGLLALDPADRVLHRLQTRR